MGQAFRRHEREVPPRQLPRCRSVHLSDGRSHDLRRRRRVHRPEVRDRRDRTGPHGGGIARPRRFEEQREPDAGP